MRATHALFALQTSYPRTLLNRFAQTFNHNQCVILAQTPLAVTAVIPRCYGLLPKGELRSKSNRKAAAARRKRPRSSQDAPQSKNGFVYFIEDTQAQTIKIGFCVKNPQKRLAALQTGNSSQLRLLGHVAGSEHHEKHLHKHFSQ